MVFLLTTKETNSFTNEFSHFGLSYHDSDHVVWYSQLSTNVSPVITLSTGIISTSVSQVTEKQSIGVKCDSKGVLKLSTTPFWIIYRNLD